MTTYRTGGHWGVTIVREGALPTDATNYRRDDDQLVAVVVNGDQSLAERICALLNARHGNPRGYHPTCIETTVPAERTFVCGPDCPPPPGESGANE